MLKKIYSKKQLLNLLLFLLLLFAVPITAHADESLKEAEELYTEFEEEFPDDPQNYRASGLEDEEQLEESVSLFSSLRMMMRSVQTLSIDQNNYLVGVDVSHHQGVINWDVLSSKSDFVFIRAGYRTLSSGALGEDNQYRYNITNANARNMKVGVYFFSQALTTAEAIEEANYLLSLVKDYKVDLGLVCDFEYAANGRLQADSLNADQETAVIEAFLDTVQDAGYTGILYANKNFLQNQIHTSQIEKDHTIWMANYTGGTQPVYNGEYRFWQYTSKESGAAFGAKSQYIDMDRWYYEVPNYTISLTIPTGYTDTTVWIDGKAYTGTVSGNTISVTLDNPNAKTASMYFYNEKGTPKGMHCWRFTYNLSKYVIEDITEFNDLINYHGFSMRISGDNGIRFMSSLPTATKSSLKTTGIRGYKINECGTLTMTKDNFDKYPLILNGEKVAKGRSYYVKDNLLYDTVYASKNGRDMFSSVLTKLKPERYNSDFTFRGYLTVKRNGTTVTFYGPPVSRSMYTVACQIMEAKEFKEGSSEYEFVKNIIDTVNPPKEEENKDSEENKEEENKDSNTPTPSTPSP